MTETTADRKKRLFYQSHHRGQVENDLLLGRFARQHLSDLHDDRLDAYERLLGEADVDIWAWVTGMQPLPARHDNVRVRPASCPSGRTGKPTGRREQMTTAVVVDAPVSTGVKSRHLLLARAAGGLDAMHLAKRIAKDGKTTVFVARDAERAQAFGRQFRFFAPNVAMLPFPAWDCLPYDRISPNSGIMATRLNTLASLSEPASSRLVLTTVNALTQLVPAAGHGAGRTAGC